MNNFKDLIIAFGNLLDRSFGVLIAAGLLFFFWGLAKSIMGGGDQKKVEEGRNVAKWGLVALFVMVSVWGIVAFFQRAFNLPLNTSQNAPIRANTPIGGVKPTLGNAPKEGVLPTKTPWWFWPANRPEPGNAPALGNAPEEGKLPTKTPWWSWPANQPKPGNAPVQGNKPK